jgi:hypothetical protein
MPTEIAGCHCRHSRGASAAIVLVATFCLSLLVGGKNKTDFGCRREEREWIVCFFEHWRLGILGFRNLMFRNFVTNPSSSVSSEMVAAGEITTDTDLIAALLSESLSELSAAVSQEKVNKEISPETFRRHRCSEPGSARSRYVWSFVFQL